MDTLRKKKVILGIAAFGPCIGILWSFGAIFTANILLKAMPGKIGTSLAACLEWPLLVIFPLGAIAGMVAFVICARHIKTQQLSAGKRLLWMMLLGLWVVGAPAYWYQFIWHEHPI